MLMSFCHSIEMANELRSSDGDRSGMVEKYYQFFNVDKLHEEIDRTIGYEHELSMDDQQRLPYLCATVQEIQRLANVVPVVQHSVTEDVTVNGYRIRKDTIVVPTFSSLLADEQLFPDSDRFQPERFIDEETGRFIRYKFYSNNAESHLSAFIT